jgi:hypothetical protein
MMILFHAAMVALDWDSEHYIGSDAPGLARVYVSDVGSASFHFWSHRCGAICGTLRDTRNRYRFLAKELSWLVDRSAGAGPATYPKGPRLRSKIVH